MNKFLSVLSVCAAFAVGFVSCSDDDGIFRNEIGSHISDGNSVCYISKHYFEMSEDWTQLLVNLESENESEKYSINALVNHTDREYVLFLSLAGIDGIDDGRYVMTFENMDGERLKPRLNVEFKGDLLQCINYVMIPYSLSKGSGSSDDPYIIGSAEDFDKFKYNLRNDPEKGKGQYFKQTESFVGLTDAGDTDRGFGCEEFAGNYDGNNKTIEYTFLGYGADTIDSNRGLFSILRDGAAISNLKIKASMTNTRYNAGALAGLAMGNVKIQDVYYHTEISAQSGYDSAVNVGGLIGKVENASLTVASAGTLDDVLNVSGRSCVGGLIGCVVNSSFDIKDVVIVHDISSANVDLAPVYSSSNYVGGVIGRVVSTNNSCSLSNCEVKTAIRTLGDYSGGLVGAFESSNDVDVSNCRVGSYVKGSSSVGGFMGIFSGSGKIQLSGTNEVRNKQIIGVSSMGGAFGTLNDTNFNLSGTTKILLGQDGVKGSGGKVGGFIGEVVSTDLSFDNNELVFSDAIKVSGTMCVGGIVGLMSDSRLSSFNVVSFSSKSTTIPDESGFAVNFCGNVAGDSRVGGAVGHATGSSIDGIYVKANVTGTDSIGGIVGSAELSNVNCTIEECLFSGIVKAMGKDIGGICGKFAKDGSINYCINYGDIDGAENVGGIAGAANYGQITGSRTFFNRCVNVGPVSGSKDVAGIVGYMHGDDDFYIKVTSCANYGSIEGAGSTTGGIVGLIPSTKGRIYYSVNHGTVYSSDACRTGGIIGKMGRDADALYQSTNLEIGWCANTGNVSCSRDSEVGGIVGFAEEGAVDYKDQDSWVHDCYNTGKISEAGGEAGGIIGYSDRYCYLLRLVNYGETDYAIVGDYKYGPALYDDYTYYTVGNQTDNIADTKLSNPGDASEYKGFSFGDIWEIDADKGHAILNDNMCPFQRVTYAPKTAL